MATALFDTAASGARVDDRERAQCLLDDAAADQALAVALDRARVLGGRDGIRRLREYSYKIAAVEAELLAEHVTSDGNTRAAERLLADGKTSKREQRKRATRAKAVNDNAGLAAKMAAGEMSEEQVDVIAHASDKTNGNAAVDSDLIDKVAAVPPEQGKAIADDYVASQATADGVQTEHDRQRKLRRAITYYAKKNGLDAILIEGDGIAKKQMWDAIEQRAHQMYLADGGRELPSHKHPRSRAQRLFDAAHELICGTATGKPTNNDSTAGSKRHGATNTRPRIVISLTIDKLLGHDPAAVATMIGYGPIPDSVLADYATHADIMAALHCAAPITADATSTTPCRGTHLARAPPTSTNSYCSAPAATTSYTPANAPSTAMDLEPGEPDPPPPTKSLPAGPRTRSSENESDPASNR